MRVFKKAAATLLTGAICGAFFVAATPAHASTASANLPIQVKQVAGMVGGDHHFLLGDNQERSPWSTYTGLAAPMIGGCGNMSAIQGTGYVPSYCAGNPMYISLSHIDDVSQAHDAATGVYNSNYANTLATQVDPYASTIYFIVIDNEWIGPWSQPSPFTTSPDGNPDISVADWEGGIQNLINTIRADHNLDSVKIAYCAPTNPAELAYTQGITGFDLFNTDLYTGAGGGSTDQQSWATYEPQLQAVDNYAAQFGVPYALTEWCDYFPDGYGITQFANWIKQHNIVENTYWDTADMGGTDTNGNVCTLDASQAKADAYTAAFNGYTYTGTFWPQK